MVKNVHIVPHGDGWAVKVEDNKIASKITDSKKEAEDIGRQMAKDLHSELIIHRHDGSIQDSDSYGNDPNPPKDKVH